MIRQEHAMYYLALAEKTAQQGHGTLWPSHFHPVMPHLPKEAAQEDCQGELLARRYSESRMRPV